MAQLRFSEIAEKGRIRWEYTKARWKLRAVSGESVLLGVDHTDTMLPYAKRMTEILRRKGYKKLGLELPENYRETRLRIDFFSELADFAHGLGYSIIPLDMALHPDNIDFFKVRHGSGDALDTLHVYAMNRQLAIKEIERRRDNFSEDYSLVQRLKSNGAAALRYIDPETRTSIFGTDPSIVRNKELLSFIELTLAKIIASFEYAKYLLENFTEEQIKAIFREANNRIDAHILGRIQATRPDLAIIGDGHASVLHYHLGSFKYANMVLPALWSLD